MSKKYIFLKGDFPEWVSERLMFFHSLNGGIGYEIDTGKFKKVVFKGDMLIKQGRYIKVVRSEHGDGAEEVD